MPGASNDRRKDGPGGVVSGETGLAHTGAIVDYESGNFFVTHAGGLLKQKKTRRLEKPI